MATRKSMKVIAARSSSCSATCAATPPSRRLPSPRRYSTSCANIMARWGPSLASSRARSTSSRATASWCFFNDPVPIPDPAESAVKMAVAMREAAGQLIAAWRERGRDLGFGAGIAQGYATLGQIGFSERSGYTAIGTVCNVAARLCAEAKDGQILLSQRVNVGLKGSVATEQVGALALKGLTQPVVAYNVPLGGGQPALRVIEGGPQSG